ncbi:MAG TPA: DUF92 domain-containing protein [Candidatus Thermoplasmatota archaeon]|nr:DUF92 domain-containing protein [Candidatus Thermoplasmatota archaeon]
MEPLWLAVVLLALGGLAIVAYALRALDLKGSVVSFLFGLVVTLVGGFGWLSLMFLFTLLGIVGTRIGYERKRARRVAEDREGERGAPNVVANGLAATLSCVALLAEPAVPPIAAQLAFATAVAAVSADTVASELGSLAGGARRILPPFPRTAIGENGSVSLPGTLAAAGAAATIAAASIPLVGIPGHLVWVPFVGGFVGCQLDSLLGATLERDGVKPGPLTKQDVNFLASAIPALAVIVVASLLH